MDYHFLALSSSKRSWYGDGEVQVFADYMGRVAAADEARRQLLANPNQAIISETVQEAISLSATNIKARRAAGRRRTPEALLMPRHVLDWAVRAYCFPLAGPPASAARATAIWGTPARSR